MALISRVQESTAAELTDAATELVDGTVQTLLGRIQQILELEVPVLAAMAGEGTSITVANVIASVVVVTLTFVASKLIQAVIGKTLARRGVTDPGTIGTTQRLAHYILLLLGFAIAIEVLGFDLTALFAAGAVVAVGFGFAMQNILQNFVSGFILLIERTIKPADVIEVDGMIVKVENMGVRATIVRTWDDEQIIIPNATLVQGTVKNFTLSDDLYRVRSRVGVAYETDLEKAKAVLLDAAGRMEGRAMQKDPVVLLWEFADSSIVFDVSVWVDNIWRSRVNRSDLNFHIWRALESAGITIAFPQLDVHLDPGVEDALSRRRKRAEKEEGSEAGAASDDGEGSEAGATQE